MSCSPGGSVPGGQGGGLGALTVVLEGGLHAGVGGPGHHGVALRRLPKHHLLAGCQPGVLQPRAVRLRVAIRVLVAGPLCPVGS